MAKTLHMVVRSLNFFARLEGLSIIYPTIGRIIVPDIVHIQISAVVVVSSSDKLQELHFQIRIKISS